MNYKGIIGGIKGFRAIAPVILIGTLCAIQKRSPVNAVRAILKAQKYRHKHSRKQVGEPVIIGLQ